MPKKKRVFCSYCSNTITQKIEGDTQRDYCNDCNKYFYDNPLPVVSVILIKNRELLLVKRNNIPYKGKWCLPSGFAESGESIQEAALRELKEETGIIGHIMGLVDADSIKNYFYGDLIFHTFEVEQTGGKLLAGDDADEVRYFPVHDTPPLAFSSNTKALNEFIKHKSEYWAIIDSFKNSISGVDENIPKSNFLSNILAEMIEQNANLISERWIKDILTNSTTLSYKKLDHDILFIRINTVLSQFEKWLSGFYYNKDISKFYYSLGLKRKAEGFQISELLSALSLTRKHIWEFAISQGIWIKTIDIYRALELDRRMVLFFDKASYWICKGYES